MSYKLSKKTIKARHDRISKAFAKTGVQINVMDLCKVFAVGEKFIDLGVDDDALVQGIYDYVQTIRIN